MARANGGGGGGRREKERKGRGRKGNVLLIYRDRNAIKQGPRTSKDSNMLFHAALSAIKMFRSSKRAELSHVSLVHPLSKILSASIAAFLPPFFAPPLLPSRRATRKKKKKRERRTVLAKESCAWLIREDGGFDGFIFRAEEPSRLMNRGGETGCARRRFHGQLMRP